MTEKNVVFIDDHAEDDGVGKTWRIPKTDKEAFEKDPSKFAEYKKNYRVVEVDGQTVRWIDAPGGQNMGFGIANNKFFVIIYAGACKKITHVKVFSIEFPKKKTPTMEEITLDELKKRVKGYTFKEID